MIDKLFRDSDQTVITPIVTPDGVTQSPINFSNAEYTIMDSRDGTILLEKSLGSGVEVDGNKFKTTIDDGELQMPYGKYWHKFVVYSIGGHKLPPVFNRLLEIE